MRLYILSSTLVYVYFLLSCSALPREKKYQKMVRSEYVPSSSSIKAWESGVGREPSCEELRAMWRFSKRQSRATEITNEIPTYRDPFAYNVWEPYARSRSLGGGALKGGGRPHVYGRIVHDVPRARPRDTAPERVRAFEEVARLLVSVPEGSVLPRRKVSTAFRLSGGGVPIEQIPLTAPQYSSFQQLKEIIRSERARELQEQRMAEETSARAAALRDEHSYFHSPADLLGPYKHRSHPDIMTM